MAAPVSVAANRALSQQTVRAGLPEVTRRENRGQHSGLEADPGLTAEV